MQESGVTVAEFISSYHYQQHKVELARHIFSQMVEAIHCLDLHGVAHNNLSLASFIVNESTEVCEPYSARSGTTDILIFSR